MVLTVGHAAVAAAGLCCCGISRFTLRPKYFSAAAGGGGAVGKHVHRWLSSNGGTDAWSQVSLKPPSQRRRAGTLDGVGQAVVAEIVPAFSHKGTEQSFKGSSLSVRSRARLIGGQARGCGRLVRHKWRGPWKKIPRKRRLFKNRLCARHVPKTKAFFGLLRRTTKVPRWTCIAPQIGKLLPPPLFLPRFRPTSISMRNFNLSPRPPLLPLLFVPRRVTGIVLFLCGLGNHLV